MKSDALQRSGLDVDRLPVHVAIIMDGNGRWAKKRLMNRVKGHEKGSQTVKSIVSACRELGIQYLTLYAFSTENWARPKSEVSALMQLLKKFLVSERRELTEKGIHDFGLHFGEKEGYLEATRLLGLNQGIGAELARGVRFLADKYGGKDFAMQTKGLEFPGYEPRGSWSMGLAYATADRGACHMRAWPIAVEAFGDLDPFTIEGKAELVAGMQDDNSSKFSAIFCDFWAVSNETQAEVLSLVLGREVTAAGLKTLGERVNNLARLFNEREGFDRKDDTLPERIFKEALPTGASAGKLLPREEFEKMLAEYYAVRGWDEHGKVSEAKKQELGL